MKIGFIGLGNMGYGMALNLLKANHEVVVYDIDSGKIDELVKHGAGKVPSPQEIGAQTDTVILCLPHPEISKDVIFNQLLSSTSKIKTIIETSTLTPEDTKEFYEKLHDQDIAFLCCPMLGGKNAALNKKIHFLVEGDEEVFNQYRNVLLDMGERADFMGNTPSATLGKLAYNICRYSNLATAAEVARFLKTYSNDTKPIYNLLVEGSLDNFGQVWKEDMRETFLSDASFKPSNIPEKDLTLIMELAKKQNLVDRIFGAIREVYRSLK